MTAADIERDHWVERYLAGRLSSSDTQRFEAYWVEHPEITDELESAASLRAGLAQLSARQELDALLRPAWWSGRLRLMALAASVAMVALAVVLWSGSRPAGPMQVAAAAAALPAFDGAPLRALTSVTVMRLRSASPVDATIELPRSPQALWLRVLPEVAAADDAGTVGSEPQAQTVRVSLGEANQAAPAMVLPAITPDAQGFVNVYVDSRALRPGRWELQLQHGATQSRFLLEVRRGAPTP